MDWDRIRSLIDSPWQNYVQAKHRSVQIDGFLGFRIDEIEKTIVDPSIGQTWSHLSAQSFQTPYPELADIVRLFPQNPCYRWLDLGAAYGRLGFVLKALRPQDSFLGYEFVEKRVQHGNEILHRWDCTSAQLQGRDLRNLSDPWPDFDLLFLFDFGQPSEIAGFLDQLREHRKSQPFSLIGSGRATRHLIATQHPWLSQVEEPLHTPHWSLYRSSSFSPRPAADT